MKNLFGGLILLFAGMFVFAACGTSSEAIYTGTRNLTSSASLVDAAWVKQLIDYHAGAAAAPANYSYNPQTHKYLIFETQWGPAVNSSYTTAYAAGHIPGALHSDTDPWENGDPSYFLLPDADLIARAGALGITKDTTVVVYSDNIVFAARLWWLLKYIGVADVRLLNGGYNAWVAAGYSVETTVNNPVPTTYDGTVNAAVRATTADVEAATASATTQIVDVRSNSEYLGYKTGYSYLNGMGRIPGAVWAHDGSGTSYSNADGTLLNPATVQAMWTSLGITSTGTTFDKDVIFYCGGGYRSALTYFYAYLLGITNVRNYSDGWAGYGTAYTANGSGGIDQTASGRTVEAGSFNVGFTTAGRNGFLVSGAAVAASIGKSNQVIIDTRSAADYAAGHIEGAINLEPKNLNTVVGFNSGLLPAADIATALGAAGISNTATIVVYGADVDATVGRMFWVLEYMGASDVHLLDGGYAKWTADARATVTTATTLTATTFTATEDATKIALKADVVANYADTANYVIVDARNNADYITAHIPNAINMLIGDFQNADKTVKSYADISTLLEGKGISVTSKKNIYTHCYVGWRSGQEYFMFRLMGYDVKNYNGSWTEYAADTTPLPTNTGATP